MAATGSSAVVGQQLDTPVYPGQVLVRQMLAATPQLASGEQVVGMLLKGDQMPSVALVAGDVVHVVAVPQAGQGSTIGGTHRERRWSPRPPCSPSDPHRPTRPSTWRRSPWRSRDRKPPRSPPMPRPIRSGSLWSARARHREVQVTLIALASVKGSPGVTTAATALAASWPEGRQVLLVEADPFGGDLAPRYAMAPTGGLSSLFAAARRTLAPEDVWDHVDHLPGGLPVLFGLGGMHQAVANEKAWPVVADALGALDADVVVDVGRLLPNLGGGVREVLARADALVVLCANRRWRPSSICGRRCPAWPPSCEGGSFSSSPPEPPSSRRPTSDAPCRSRCSRPCPTTRRQQPRWPTGGR